MKLMRPEEVKPGTVLTYDGTADELAEVYRLAREAFSASDLQKYTEPLEGGIPFEDVLRKMEEEQARSDAKRKQS